MFCLQGLHLFILVHHIYRDHITLDMWESGHDSHMSSVIWSRYIWWTGIKSWRPCKQNILFYCRIIKSMSWLSHKFPFSRMLLLQCRIYHCAYVCLSTGPRCPGGGIHLPAKHFFTMNFCLCGAIWNILNIPNFPEHLWCSSTHKHNGKSGTGGVASWRKETWLYSYTAWLSRKEVIFFHD
jgi:hypothetical protein